MPLFRLSLRALAVLSIATLPVLSAQAQTYTWYGAFGGLNYWGSGGNWYENSAPQSGAATQLVFGPTTGATKTSNNDLSNLQVNVLRFTESGYNLNGNALTLTGTTPQLTQTVAGTNTSNLDMIATSGIGADLASGANLFVNGRVTGAGNLTKTGTGTLILTNTANSLTGNLVARDGTLSLRSGGILNNAVGYIGSGSGTSAGVTVNGGGSQWRNTGSLFVGDSGSGRLTISNGGLVTSTLSYIGYGVGSSGTVNVVGTGSHWDGSTQDHAPIYLGFNSGSSGTLNILGGGRLSNNDTYIGYGVGGSGSLTVSGAGTQWGIHNVYGSPIAGSVYVGYWGNGQLAITDGAVVNKGGIVLAYTQGSSGSLLIDGAGTQVTVYDIRAGVQGESTLRITNGAMVTSLGTSIGNIDAFYASTATVDGVGTRWNLGFSSISVFGNSTLDITGGAVVNGGGAILYGRGNSSVTNVRGAGTQWNNFYDVRVGGITSAFLNITDGAVVTNRDAYVGNIENGTVATVRGAGSQWNNSGTITIGANGPGTVRVQDGGTLAAAADTRINSGSVLAAVNGTVRTGTLTGTGTIQVAGSGLTLDQSSDSTFSGTIQNGATAGTLIKTGTGVLTLPTTSTHSSTVVQGGTLALTPSAILTGNMTVAGGILANNGTVGGFTTITGGVARGTGNYAGGYALQNSGTLRLGDTSPGTVRSGSATWSGGTLLIPMNDATGTAGSGWGLNQITGNLSLVSTATPITIALQSLQADGTFGALTHFDPTQSYTWDIVRATTGISGFASANFVLDTSAFLSYNPGALSNQFSLVQLGNTLSVKYGNIIVVPETGTGLLVLLGGVVGIVGTIARRRLR